jgi:uncharacterized protein (DUF58 family)
VSAFFRPLASAPLRPGKHYWLPRTIRPTREGVWFLAVTLAVGLAATNTGNNLLYLILAMLLAFLVISGILSEQTLRRVTLRREIPRRLFAGAPAAFALWLGNGKRRVTSYALHVAEADPAGGRPATRFFLRVGPRAREAWRYSLTFPRRGRQTLPGLVVWTRFPFGLFSKLSRPLLVEAVLVYPAVRPLRPEELPCGLGEARRPRDRRGLGSALRNLRQYRAGDDPRLIHWKTSARTGELMLKELEEEGRPQLRLVVEDPAPGAAADRIEADLSTAASLATWAVRGGTAVELVTAEGPSGFGEDEAHLDRILTRLALYEAPPAPRPMARGAGEARTIRLALGQGSLPSEP